MTISIINTTLTTTVTPGAGNYALGITITNTGAIIEPKGYDQAIFSNSISGVSVLNDGQIYGDVILLQPATILNYGTISGEFQPVYLAGGGTVVNSGVITTGPDGSSTGVDVRDAFSVVNSGMIYGATDGLSEFGSGDVVNSGFITGGTVGVLLQGAGASLTNSGVVSGGYSGIDGQGYGSVRNTGQVTGGKQGVRSVATLLNYGLIEGGAYGVTGSDVITNGGTIEGTTYAIYGFEQDGKGLRLTVDPGALFEGTVQAPDGQIYLDGTSKAYLDMGTSFIGFSDISFATGSKWSIEGGTIDLAGGQTITGFTGGDTITVDGFVAKAGKTKYVAGTGLELKNQDGDEILLKIVGPKKAKTADFVISDINGDTRITYVACFAAGTRILTATGRAVPVQNLAVGDMLALHDGAVEPIRWIGRRKINVKRHPRPETARPVLIEAGALGQGLPLRDLYLSPDHALFLDGHLIPAKALLNGFSIRQVECSQVTYYHIELPDHAVLFAEGVAAESYLESGNRSAFENGGGAVMLHPDFAQSLRAANACAPLVESGPVVEAVRQRILDRAGIETTEESGLRIHFEPDGAAVVASRSGVPGELTADPRDRRRLGVKIASIVIGGRDIPVTHKALKDGWHDPESDGRWTNGRAVIPARLLDGQKDVKLRLAGMMRYPLGKRTAGAALANAGSR